MGQIAARDVTVKPVMTDKADFDRSAVLAKARAARHIRLRPYAPRPKARPSALGANSP